MNTYDVETLPATAHSLFELKQLPLVGCDEVAPHQLERILAQIEDAQLKVRLLSWLCRVPRLDVRLDFENLYIGLKRMGRPAEPEALINAVRRAVDDLGEITRITAYADWIILDRKNGPQIQRQLELADLVETRYQVNIKNKNSADMRIASDIHDHLEMDGLRPGPSMVDIFVLGTGDRDFRPVVQKIKDRGKKVIVLALKNSLSRLLMSAATEVRYLEDYLIPEPASRRRY